MPVILRVAGLRALVLGGGPVGERRATQLAGHGARVRVAALEFTPGLLEAAAEGLVELVRIDLREASTLEGLIEWADIVVVATSDPRVNKQAARIALERGKLVNDATQAQRGNVIVPFHASLEGLGLLVAVSSLGRAGVAARMALEKCEEALSSDVELGVVAYTMARLKAWLKRVEPDPKRRLSVYFAVAGDDEYRRLASQGRREEALRRALEIASTLLGEGEHAGGLA